MKLNSITPGLMLIHSNRPEQLRTVVVEWIKHQPVDPLETETFLVQSSGVAQWLKLALASDRRAEPGAGGCGIAAALEVALPSSFIWRTYRAVLGEERVAAVSPLDRSRLIWRLMRLLPAMTGDAAFEPLRRFIADDDDGRKRYQLATRIADLFEQYQTFRADWLERWAQSEDIVFDAHGRPQALANAHRWQPALWRALPDAVRQGGRAAVHAEFMERMRDVGEDACPAGLPRRIVVFGISSLPRQTVDVLAVLARWSQVVICVNNPCAHYWSDIVSERLYMPAREARQPRRASMPAEVPEAALHLHAHPLLASWGRKGRDFVRLLDGYDSIEARKRYCAQVQSIEQRIDLFDQGDTSTLLGRLQDDIRELRALHETRAHWGEVQADPSIQFHIAHSAQREVEILHDQLLAAFNADTSLRPQDVIVLAPDIETYAPHIEAVFGLPARKGPRYIPFNIADRAQRKADPLIGALGRLLRLPDSRMRAGDVLDLLDVPALRKRFRIDEAAVPTLSAWIREANVRWGLHAQQRASLGLQLDAQAASRHTWAFGLRRMLLGYASGAQADPWHDIEPFDEIGGLDALSLGPLVKLIDALEETWRRLSAPATVAQWCESLRALTETFFSASDDDEAQTLARLDGVLERWLVAAEEAGLVEPLPLAVVAEHWLSELDGAGLSQRFLSGAVTFATLTPMRTITFRHVCLLGMNDGDYPRLRVPMGFDLMREYPRAGDRSQRDDDRYLLLETILAARDRLHVSWIGRSVQDNSASPPSVLIGQLRDHLAAGWRLAGAPAARSHALLDALTVEHPLQPFSASYFAARSEASRLFTYADEWRAEPSRAMPANSASGALLSPLAREEALTLRDLVDFLKDPVKAFFTQRLRVKLDIDGGAEDSIDEEPFELNQLEVWKLQDELIKAQTAALDDESGRIAARDRSLAAMRRRGDVLTGGFGERLSEGWLDTMETLFSHYRKQLARWPIVEPGERAIEFQVEGAGQTLQLADWLGHWRKSEEGARARVLLSTSSIVDNGGKYRYDKLLDSWGQHLAASLTGPMTTVVVSRKGTVEWQPMSREAAGALLATWIRAWEAGMREPLPLAVNTAYVWLNAAYGLNGAKADDEAARDAAWKAARNVYGKSDRYHKAEVDSNEYLRRAFPDFDALSADGRFESLTLTLLYPPMRTQAEKKQREVAKKKAGGARPKSNEKTPQAQGGEA
ncbi:MAG TPA: exodeoxyribonuclease V subunit gamma [Paraburkholderia sp.]|uniref:exodeoxyribonuclease V subunit gamma n=1 Tax=Paraburkholderia sp. TaxID=1926495 RepID=UPI002B4A4151|nr:exodeoxyribonuclease V subunit gamma [Paraburkholderia sp.]HKR44950.1 exodeoxyribonuclease V subunit gamma [Paraburkholderia sp.]